MVESVRVKTSRKRRAQSATPDAKLLALAALPSLGLTSAQMLIDAGVQNVAMLRKMAPEACFRALRFRFGRRVSINFIYAIECAVRGIGWKTLEPARKAALRDAASDIVLALEGVPTSKRKKVPQSLANQSRSGAPGGKNARYGRASSTARAKEGRASRRPR
jgi:hypothetical protein